MRRGLLLQERGEIGLMQLLMALLISGIVLGATLSVFQTLIAQDTRSNARNDAQQQARSALDRLARDLRNLASPTEDVPEAIDRAGARDMIFKTVDSDGPNAGANVTNVQRVRYCLDTGNAAEPRLVAQRQTWTTAAPPAYPSDAACPGTGWTTTTTLAEHVTNYSDGLARPLFTYNAGTLGEISSIHADLRVDLHTGRGPTETSISTGVFLRNQNRVPTASFTWHADSRGAVLNASASSDPEGQLLKYEWYADGGADPVGEGITFLFQATGGSTHTIRLKVSDPAGLTAEHTETGVTA
jgi:hypothetical protein